MGFFSEFKEFATKGNVMDLAVGVIIGGAFGKIVDSLVGDVVMPVVGKVLGGLDAISAASANLPIGISCNISALTESIPKPFLVALVVMIFSKR